jgi:ecotin
MKKLTLLLACLLALPLFATEEAEKNLKPFPAAKDGMIRHVIVLPHKERGEEDAFRVEIIVGQKVMGDSVNRMMMGGKIEEKDLEGWGFTYFVATPGAVAQTLMAPMENEAPVERFVTMPPKQIRYNSRLPIVVYTPGGMEVQYRIWSAGEETHSAKVR